MRRADNNRGGNNITRRDIWEQTHKNPDRVADVYIALQSLLPARYAVIGAYAYGAVVEPRETQDIDILMARRSAVALAKRLATAAPGITWKERSNVVEIRLDGNKIIDLPPDEHPLFKEILANHIVERQIPRFGKAPTPTVEALMATKFLALMSPYRRSQKKLRDAADLFDYWETCKRCDRTALGGLLDLIGPKAQVAFWQMVTNYDNGEPISI